MNTDLSKKAKNYFEKIFSWIMQFLANIWKMWENMIKSHILMNETVYLGLSILDLVSFGEKAK